MNFLLGAIIILIIVLTGFGFRLAYLTKSYKHIFKGSVTEEFAFAVIPTLLIQIPLYLFVNSFVCNVNEQQLYYILINSDKASPDSLSIGLFALHNLTSIGIGILFGYLFRRLSLKRCWHLKYNFLKIYNDWQEYFEGFVLDRPDIPGNSSELR